jgi:WhiB family redox-sensing transcriptional regulator
MSARAYPGVRPLRPVVDVWSWQVNALCRDTDPAMFFHPEGERGRARKHRQQKAKAVCAKCPVVAQCREHALRFGEDFGTWGGLSEDDRDLSHRQVRRR